MPLTAPPRTAPARLIAAALLLAALCGCSSTEEKPIELPVNATSMPVGAEVSYRITEVPRAQVIPKASEWVYLGRTPYDGKAKLPRTFIDRGGNMLQIRIRMQDYEEVVREIPQPEVDLKRGVRVVASLRSNELEGLP